MKWYLVHIFPLQRTFWGVAEPLAHRVTSMPLPTGDFFDNIKRFYTAIGDMSDLMLSPDTSIRLVVNPEKMVIHEAQRAYTYFCLYGFRVDAVMVNRIYPDSLKDTYFERWKALQKEYLETIVHSFAPLPICRTPLFEKEMLGAANLLSMAGAAYEGRDPAELFYSGNPFRIKKRGSNYIVTIELPFVDKKNVDLLHRGDELIIKTGVGKRVIMLPESMRGARVERAGMEGEKLNVYFEKADTKGEKGHGRKKSGKSR
jgi:arsenite-transporting ATPase